MKRNYSPGPYAIDRHSHEPILKLKNPEGLTVAHVIGGLPDGDHELNGNAAIFSMADETYQLAKRIATLNADAGEIGPGMLAQLVQAAQAIIARTGEL